MEGPFVQFDSMIIAIIKSRGGSRGGLWGLETPLQKYIRACEAKRMMYWYKNILKNVLFLELSEFSVLYEIKQPISSKGLHPPRPLLHIWLKTSLYIYLLKYALNLGLGMILVAYY